MRTSQVSEMTQGACVQAAHGSVPPQRVSGGDIHIPKSAHKVRDPPNILLISSLRLDIHFHELI